MDPDLRRDVGRWMEAEREGRDAEADAAFKAVFRSAPQHAARPGFADRVMAAVAADTARRATRAKAAAALGIAAGLAGVVALAVFLFSRGPRLLFDAVDVGVRGAVWTADAVDRGLDLWSILAQIGKVSASVIATPEVTAGLVAIEVVGVLALYGLQRILSSEQESSS